MSRLLFLVPILLGAALPAFAVPGTDTGETRNARNWDVMLSQYPARAREAREQGPVGFRVTLDGEGYATECVVTSSSGYPRLDDETCTLIMTRGEFRGITDESGRKAKGVFEGVVNWRLPLPAIAAAAAATSPPAQSEAPVRTARAGSTERLICRRKLKTGSLVEFERTCLTAGDWQKFTENQRAFWRDVQGIKGACSTPDCN